MKDYTLLQTWQPTTENDFKGLEYDFIDNPDVLYYGTFNSLAEIVSDLEYQDYNFSEIVKLTKNRYGHVIEIIEYESNFYVFIGVN